MKKSAFIASLLALAFAMPASAATVSGSRTTGGGGLTGAGVWDGVDDNGFKIAWEIDDLGGGLWEYNYTFSGASGTSNLTQALSHFIIELSLSITDLDPTSSNATFGDIEIKTQQANSGNPGMPGDVYGIKVNMGPGDSGGNGFTVSFVVDKEPILGNFYAKGPTGTYVYNDGFGTTPADIYDLNNLNFIVRPDTFSGGEIVPLPASAWMGGLGLACVMGWQIIRRRQA